MNSIANVYIYMYIVICLNYEIEILQIYFRLIVRLSVWVLWSETRTGTLHYIWPNLARVRI